MIAVERRRGQAWFLKMERSSVGSPDGTEEILRPPFVYGLLFRSVDSAALYDVGNEFFAPTGGFADYRTVISPGTIWK